VLQIIGWLGCLYLLVKGLELMGSVDQQEEPSIFSKAAAALAVVGSFLFAVLLLQQEQTTSSPMEAVPLGGTEAPPFLIEPSR
jgi:hypothetical protein